MNRQRYALVFETRVHAFSIRLRNMRLCPNSILSTLWHDTVFQKKCCLGREC